MVEISSKSIFVPPKSDNFFEGMRQGVGYSFVTALADIIDNSLTAGASNIHIVTEPDSKSISIIDNGIGMDDQERHIKEFLARSPGIRALYRDGRLRATFRDDHQVVLDKIVKSIDDEVGHDGILNLSSGYPH